jgi:wyosine [tRNA(Phe)-imidazoG37] synthetase (radical SAM superfamily)
MSLGVDLIPHKICTLDCVYCECGPTTKLTTVRKEYVLYDKVIRELEHYFENNGKPDYITFSGAGEPTLHSRIGEIIGYIKQRVPDIPVAVLTNGTLFNRPDVRREIGQADLVLPSLDAVTQRSFEKVNRPIGDLDITEYIKGLVSFSKEFRGEIWLEIMIIPGYNDHKEELIKMKEVILKINPSRVQINTLDRPGTLDSLRPSSTESLEDIVELWQIENVEIIARVKERKEVKSYRDDIASAIIETISRRPCTLDDLKKILGLHENEINKYLGTLEEEQKIETFRQKRGIFYRMKS